MIQYFFFHIIRYVRLHEYVDSSEIFHTDQLLHYHQILFKTPNKLLLILTHLSHFCLKLSSSYSSLAFSISCIALTNSGFTSNCLSNAKVVRQKPGGTLYPFIQETKDLTKTKYFTRYFQIFLHN